MWPKMPALPANFHLISRKYEMNTRELLFRVFCFKRLLYVYCPQKTSQIKKNYRGISRKDRLKRESIFSLF